MSRSTGKLQAVFFDCNGVIIDDEPIHMRLFQEVLGKLGITLTTEEYYETYIGMDDKSAFDYSLHQAGKPVTASMINDLVSQKAKRYKEVIAKEMVLIPGAVDLVKSLHGKVPLGLVSGALRHEIELILKAAGIRICFEAVVASEDFVHGKPNPDPYQLGFERLKKALGKTDLEARYCVAIEDTAAGIDSAQAAGMRCVAVVTSSPRESLLAADRIIKSLSGLQLSDLDALVGNA